MQDSIDIKVHLAVFFIINCISEYFVVEATESLLSFLKHCCSGILKDELLLGSLWLQFYLENPRNRSSFVKERIDFVELIVSQLKNVKSNQIQYQFLFCLWLLTFDRCNCDTLVQLQDIVPNLIETAKLAVKEKVVRLVVSCLANLLRFSKSHAIPQFVGSKVSLFIETLQTRTYSDQEFVDDIASLSEELKIEIQKLRLFTIKFIKTNYLLVHSTNMHRRLNLDNWNGAQLISLSCFGSITQQN